VVSDKLRDCRKAPTPLLGAYLLHDAVQRVMCNETCSDPHHHWTCRLVIPNVYLPLYFPTNLAHTRWLS
jgi:hypothetical protein